MDLIFAKKVENQICFCGEVYSSLLFTKNSRAETLGLYFCLKNGYIHGNFANISPHWPAQQGDRLICIFFLLNNTVYHTTLKDLERLCPIHRDGDLL